MTNALFDLSVEQLQHALELRQQIDNLKIELDHIQVSPAEAPGNGVAPRRGRPPGSGGRRKRRTMTPAALRALAQAREKRWANVRAQAASGRFSAKPKKKFSAAARAALSAAAKARWRKAKASGRTTL